MADKYRHQTKYVKRQEKSGLVRVAVWVPDRLRHKLIDYAETLRKTPAKKKKRRNPAKD